MMQYTKQDVDSTFGETLDDVSKIQFEKHFQLVYTSYRKPDSTKSYGGAYGIVGIFEVKY
jgi:hypothetical protein